MAHRQRPALFDRLGMFHPATTRAAALRDQLAVAEESAGTLHARLDHHGGPTVKVGEEADDGAGGVHDKQVVGDESGEQHRLA
ncbi:hypothetical protein [Micromonospora sp. NPDC004551]|uniref:hypothetical protein n=1 Tax=Micromonospora sp. NPDC004551 TaxID=3154284 RepID=UPI0033A95BAC